MDLWRQQLSFVVECTLTWSISRCFNFQKILRFFSRSDSKVVVDIVKTYWYVCYLSYYGNQQVYNCGLKSCHHNVLPVEVQVISRSSHFCDRLFCKKFIDKLELKFKGTMLFTALFVYDNLWHHHTNMLNRSTFLVRNA